MPVAGCPADPHEAATFLFGAARGGSGAAANNLGTAYADGRGVTKNLEAAARWLKQAAENANSAIPEYNLAMIYGGEYGPADQPESQKWLSKAAARGDPASTFLLGVFLTSGAQGAAKDENAGNALIEKSASAGYGPARYCIASDYLNGKTRTQDTAKGIALLRECAENGIVMAQLQIADYYQRGQYIEKNPSEALRWFTKAADEGSGMAKFALGVYLDEETHNPTGAFRLYLEAAEKGVSMAYKSVGRAYALGKGVAENKSEALRWLEKCPDKSWLMTDIAGCWGKGTEVTKDPNKGMAWLRLAGEAGYPWAWEEMAKHYEEGDWGQWDPASALEWRLKAARGGWRDSAIGVAQMYERGFGVPKDEVEALAWYYAAGAMAAVGSETHQQRIERRLGHDMSLVAQQRAKRLLAEEQEPTLLRRDGKAAQSALSGTGVIISPTGHILTAAHVVANATEITVLRGAETSAAKVLAMDEANDIAVLKIEGRGLPAAPLGTSSSVRFGQMVATIGFPNVGLQGVSPKVTRGEITSINGAGDDPRCWQISVPVQPGNSGGALIDAKGAVIGIVISKLGLKAAAITGDIPQNVNYAVKIAYAMPLLDRFAGAVVPKSPNESGRTFEDMIADAEKSTVLIVAR